MNKLRSMEIMFNMSLFQQLFKESNLMIEELESVLGKISESYKKDKIKRPAFSTQDLVDGCNEYIESMEYRERLISSFSVTDLMNLQSDVRADLNRFKSELERLCLR